MEHQRGGRSKAHLSTANIRGTCTFGGSYNNKDLLFRSLATDMKQGQRLKGVGAGMKYTTFQLFRTLKLTRLR